MANSCRNLLRITVKQDQAEKLMAELRGPDIHWTEIQHISDVNSGAPLTAHQKIQLNADRDSIRDAYLAAGRPEWMPISEEDLLWYIKNNGNISEHPCLKEVPFSLAKLAPWAGIEEYRAYASHYHDYSYARFGIKWTPHFHTDEFFITDCPDDEGQVILDLTSETPWSSPGSAISLAKNVLLAHGAEAIWGYSEPGMCFAGADVLQDGEIVTFYWSDEDCPTVPDEDDPGFQTFDPAVAMIRLVGAGIKASLAHIFWEL